MNLYGKIKAYSRIAGAVLVLAFYLSQLMILTWLFGHSDDRGFVYRTKFIKGAMKVLGIRLVVEGEIPNGQFLWVSNHRSMFDPMILLRDIKAFVVSKAEVENYPLIGKGARETGVIYVNRNQKSSRAAALQAIRDTLARKRNILIYPEGTTSNLPTTNEFRIGSFRVAAELGVAVVPVALDYEDNNDYWASGSLLPHVLKVLARRKTNAMIRIGKPIDHADPKILMAEARNWINQQIPEMHEKLNTR